MFALEFVLSDGHNDHMKRAPLKLPPDTVGVADAKRDLTSLIDRVLASGKSITIARRGKAVVRIVPIAEKIGTEWHKGMNFRDGDPFFEIMEKVIADRKTRPMRGHPPAWKR